jgi:hypothetical protein
MIGLFTDVLCVILHPLALWSGRSSVMTPLYYYRSYFTENSSFAGYSYSTAIFYVFLLKVAWVDVEDA